MNEKTAAIMIASLEAVKYFAELAALIQSGGLTDEEIAARWSETAGRVALADQRWTEAGQAGNVS